MRKTPAAPGEPQAQISADCDALDAALERLVEQLLGEDLALSAEVYQLPYLTVPVKGEPAPDPNAPILPLKLVGESARWMAATVIMAWRYKSDQHPKAVQRLPGVLASSPNTIACIEEVNAAKRNLAAHLKNYAASLSDRLELDGDQIKEKGSKYELLREESATIKHLHILQATRELRVLEDQTERIAFSWSSHHAAHRPRLASKIRADFRQALARGPSNLSPEPTEDWDKRYGEYLESIFSVPDDEELVFRRPTPPLPVANTSPPPPKGRPLKASLPLFLKAGVVWPALDPLTDFIPGRRRLPTRSDKQVDQEPLIEDLHLYRYLPDHRDKLHAKVSFDRIGPNGTFTVNAGGPLQGAVHVDVEDLRLALASALETFRQDREPRQVGDLVIRPAAQDGLMLHLKVGGKLRRVPWSRQDAAAVLKGLPTAG